MIDERIRLLIVTKCGIVDLVINYLLLQGNFMFSIDLNSHFTKHGLKIVWQSNFDSRSDKKYKKSSLMIGS